MLNCIRNFNCKNVNRGWKMNSNFKIFLKLILKVNNWLKVDSLNWNVITNDYEFLRNLI